MNASISINRELKKQAETLFENYGMSLSDTISNFINRMIKISAKSSEFVAEKPSSPSAFGSLSKYANANLRVKEKDVWEIHARKKYTECK
jgi:hypothetical protein